MFQLKERWSKVNLPTFHVVRYIYFTWRSAGGVISSSKLGHYIPSYFPGAISFYRRPVLAFGYCHRLRLCVCPCVCQFVCQSLACPRDNLGPVQARIAKFWPKMQKTLFKVHIVLEGNWLWPSRSNLTSKSEFTPFWACPGHNSSPIQVRITKFGPEVANSSVKVPIILGGNWPWPSRSDLI